MKTQLFLMLMAGAVLIIPSFASAESDMKPSFSNKKSGHVAFEAKKDATDEAISAAEEVTDPSQIEPAAGDESSAAAAQENKLADDLKLPRKN